MKSRSFAMPIRCTISLLIVAYIFCATDPEQVHVVVKNTKFGEKEMVAENKAATISVVYLSPRFIESQNKSFSKEVQNDSSVNLHNAVSFLVSMHSVSKADKSDARNINNSLNDQKFINMNNGAEIFIVANSDMIQPIGMLRQNLSANSTIEFIVTFSAQSIKSISKNGLMRIKNINPECGTIDFPLRQLLPHTMTKGQ
jgi:hypothetical protein